MQVKSYTYFFFSQSVHVTTIPMQPISTNKFSSMQLTAFPSQFPGDQRQIIVRHNYRQINSHRENSPCGFKSMFSDGCKPTAL